MKTTIQIDKTDLVQEQRARQSMNILPETDGAVSDLYRKCDSGSGTIVFAGGHFPRYHQQEKINMYCPVCGRSTAAGTGGGISERCGFCNQVGSGYREDDFSLR
ncbi:MAG: hypothetical protein R2860_12900 [Desulfobacterales bacterium]